jgi:hypothetical protein
MGTVREMPMCWWQYPRCWWVNFWNAIYGGGWEEANKHPSGMDVDDPY